MRSSGEKNMVRWSVCSLLYFLTTSISWAAVEWQYTDTSEVVDGVTYEVRNIVGASNTMASFYLTVRPVLRERAYKNITIKAGDNAQTFVFYDNATVGVGAYFLSDLGLLQNPGVKSVRYSAQSLLMCTGFLNWNFGPLVSARADESPKGSWVRGCAGNQGVPTQIWGS